MVADADRRGVKLTIMLTAQWADYIAAEAGRRAVVLGWIDDGHELAGHHHSVYHPGTWDGYSDFTEMDRAAILGPRGALTPHEGTLADWAAAVQAVIPGFRAGCGNGERDKRVIPAAIEFDTCPGVYTADREVLGTRLDGSDPYAGQNDFVLMGTTDGVERRFLNHGLIGGSFLEGAQAAFDAASTGAYGVVVHTKEADVAALRAWMDHVVAAGKGQSATVTAIMTRGGLPIRRLAAETLNQVYSE